MRSLLIIFGAFALLGGGFFIYYSLQTSSHHAAGDGGAGAPREMRAAASTTAPVTPPRDGGEGAGPAGPGNDVWVQSLDEQMRVAFQFRASRYDPTREGPVNVTHPQAEVFIGRDDARQVVRIEGRTGRVVMPSDVAQRSAVRGNEASAPRRGELKDVTISLFDEADTSRPLLVCRVDNITFDNDTFRIATEAYTDPAGADVAADQVKVEVRGDEFDFDGRGLTIQWNEADRRLQLLEIAHGERLTVKSPEMLQALDRTAGPKRVRAKPAERDQGATVELASMRRPPGPKARPSTASAPLYRATFRDRVRITRGDAVIASSDQMLVDFISDRKEPVSPGSAGGARRKTTSDPAPNDAGARHASPSPSPSPAPATAPAQPVHVNWVGKLRVTALAEDAPRPAPGSLNVAMSSDDLTPVVLNHQGMLVRCASFDYRSGDDSLAVISSKALPTITMTLANGTTIRTPSVVYTGADAKATLRGASTAEIPLPQEEGRPAQKLGAAWDETCVLRLVPGPGGARELRPDRAIFTGDVRIDHPQLAMRSDALELGFDPAAPADQPAPDEMKATGSVRCRLVDVQGTEQRINCDDLTVAVEPAAAGGKLVPKTLVAEGNVVATDEGTELRAGRLTIALVPVAAASVAAPADRQGQANAGVWGGGDFQVESVTAQEDVKLATRDGRTATAEQAHVVTTPDGTVAELLGQPATLGDGTDTLSGPHIKYEQGPQRASVRGPGTLAFTVRDAPDQPARAVTAAWESGLTYDGAANRAELSGGASVTAPAADGSTQRASGDRIVVTFADAPAAPTTGAARADAAGAKAHPDGFDLAGDKVLRGITLSGDAQVQSTRDGAEAGQVRRIHLLAPAIHYDVASKRAEVPSAGRMLVQDTLPARAGEAEAGNRMLGNFRGATAFQWSQRLVFDQSANRFTMSGSVLIVHEDPQRADQSFRMEAAQVRADLLDGSADDSARVARDNPDARDPGAGGGAAALFGPSELHLKALSASGDVRIAAPQIQIDAQDIGYDAVGELLTARGTDRQPVQVYDRAGASRGSFEQVVWDARAELIKQMREVRAQVRR